MYRLNFANSQHLNNKKAVCHNFNKHDFRTFFFKIYKMFFVGKSISKNVNIRIVRTDNHN